MFYSYNYQAIILITYDNNVPVLKLENKKSSLELSFVGKLIGHLSLIVSGCFLEEKGILATIDELNVIKFWNLKKMICLKSV